MHTSNFAYRGARTPTHMCTYREVERREKVEEARRETERILAAQEAEVKARKAEMERRDK